MIVRATRKPCTSYRLGALLAMVVVAPGALAITAPPQGEPVRSIEGADAISGWSALDNLRVLVSLDERNAYLLTLKHQCHGLAWAQNVSVTMSNNTIWAGFDAIQADGLACPIDSIHRIDPRDL